MDKGKLENSVYESSGINNHGLGAFNHNNSNNTNNNNIMNDGSGVTHIHKPPTTVKVFVGQIPKTMFEEQLKSFFENYGHVVEVSVIR